MTSSLVGSEMCIRDSDQDVADLLNDWWNTGTINPEITKSKVFMAYKKLSLIHILTLPTICSV
eukprot:10391260-Prorocentrum_lima.AAC.1